MTALTWFRQLFTRKPSITLRRLQLWVEALEDRLAPATFSEVGALLHLDLNVANEAVSIVSNGDRYALTLTGSTWSGTDSANVTGNGSTTLSVTGAGLAAFNTVQLTDSATNTAVTFADSGANAYSDAFNITLDDTPGAVTFNGASPFGANNLTVTTARNILVNNGALVQTSSGNLTFSANQQATATTGNFQGINVDGGTVQVTGTGALTLQGRGGTDGSGNQVGVYLSLGQVQSGTGSVSVIGSGGGSSGDGNSGVFVGTAQITSGGGAVSVTGTGGGGSFSSGVFVSLNGEVSAGGTGTVTVVGTGSDGVDVYGPSGKITSNGGAVSVTGHSTGGSGNTYGVLLNGGGQISAGGLGSVTVLGSGGASPDESNDGVRLEGTGTQITSSGGAVAVTGSAGAGEVGSNSGVYLAGARISAGGTGSVHVTGSGGASSGDSNYGVWLRSGAQITSSGGAVVVTGTGGGAAGSSANFGVAVDGGTQISAGELGSVHVTGTGGASAGNGNTGVSVVGMDAQITSGGGAVAVTGISGSAYGLVVFASGTISTAVNGGDLTLTADSIFFDSSAVVAAGANHTVTLQNRTAGRPIDLGGDDVFGPTGSLGLSDAELDRVSGGTLVIGRSDAQATGTLTINSPITRDTTTNLTLVSLAGIQPLASDTDLDLAGGTLSFGSESKLVIEIQSSLPAPGYTQLTVNGTVDVTGVNLVLSGADPLPGQTITPVNATSLVGQFNTAVEPTLLPPIDEDTPSPAGYTVATLLADRVADPDAGALTGVAIIAVTGAADGGWQFSLNAGTTWLALGSPTAATARLLRDSDKIRFVPAAHFTGSAALTYRAWDQTAGTAGETVDLGSASAVGGATSFSAAQRTALAVVSPVNDAPVLDVGGKPPLTPVTPGTTDPVGDLVSTLLGASVTDVDAGALQGIAITSAPGQQGTWQYRLAGEGSWSDVGTVSATSVLLLRGEDHIRFVPTTGFSGTVKLGYRAWDQTFGTVGTKVASGTNTAFSVANESAPLLVGTSTSAANHAPVLDIIPDSTLTSVREDNARPAGDTVASLLRSAVTDGDARARQGIAVVGLTGTEGGAWQFSRNGGTTWKPLGAVSHERALLLRDTDKLRFVPRANFNGTVTLRYAAWDQTRGSAGKWANLTRPGTTGETAPFSSAVETATLTVQEVNDAPILNANLQPILAGATNPNGDAIASLLGGAISDVDAGARQGIAVTAAPGTGGQWQFRLQGEVVWNDIDAVTRKSVLLLRSEDSIRFVPATGFTGVATLSYRAWDQTSGTAGDRVAPGSRTAFSKAVETTTLTVNAVNDRPVLNAAVRSTLPPVLPGASDPVGARVDSLVGASISDVDPGAAMGIAVTGTSTAGKWQWFDVGMGVWKDIDAVSATSALLLRGEDWLRFVPAAGGVGASLLSFKAWDQTSGSAGTTADPTVGTAFSLAADVLEALVNTAPVLS